MRVSFYATLLLPLISSAVSVQASSDAMEYLNILGQSETTTDLDLEGSSEAVVDLDCLGELITDCANGNTSACDKMDQTEPLPCML